MAASRASDLLRLGSGCSICGRQPLTGILARVNLAAPVWRFGLSLFWRACARAQGYFYAPTIIADASIEMKIFREETFGPAVPLFKFKDDAEAVQLANDSEYGLASYFFTKVGRRAVKSCQATPAVHGR